MDSIEITKLSSRGQIVIPKGIREKMSWDTGDYVQVETKDDVVILRRLIVNSRKQDKPKNARISLIK